MNCIPLALAVGSWVGSETDLNSTDSLKLSDVLGSPQNDLSGRSPRGWFVLEFFLVGSWKKVQMASGQSVQLQSLEWLESLAILNSGSVLKSGTSQGSLGPDKTHRVSHCPANCAKTKSA